MRAKVALVTGATSGFGRAIAIELAREGAEVMLSGRSRERGAQVLEHIRGMDRTAELELCDLTDPGACEALVAATERRFGRLDVLVNNAGIWHVATAEKTTDAQWHQTLAINLNAVFFLSRAALPLMRRSGGGSIVNISSDWGLVGGEEGAAYCASKGAVVLLTKAMALDHARENIRINAVCPSDCDTPMMEADARHRGMDYAEARRMWGEALPMGRVGTAEDVAHLVNFLASDRAGFITGAAIPIDGGNTAR